MSRSIVWEDCDVRAYVDGAEVAGLFATAFTLSDTFRVDRARFQGSSTPDLDATYDGATGTIDLRLKKGFGNPADVTEPYKSGVKDREATGVVRLVVSHNSPNGGGREAYRLDNCHINSTARGGEDSPVSVSWSYEAENAERIQ